MKKNLLVMGVMAAAAFTLTNCTEEIQSAPEVEKVPYTIYADAADTKTENDGLSTVWVEGDALNVFHAPAGATEYGDNSMFTLSDAEAGKFVTEELKGELAEVNDWYVLYPYNKYVTTPAAKDKGYINVGSKTAITQYGYGTMAHLSGLNCPLYGVAKGVSDETIPALVMNHLTSVVKVEVTNNTGDDIVVSNVVFTAPEEICGTFYVDFTGEAPGYVGSGANYVSNSAAVNVSGAETLAAGQTADVYVVIKPFTAKAGSELKLSVNGSEKTKTLDADVVFAPGCIKTLTFSLEETAEPDAIADVIEGGAGETVLTEGLVIATYARGFLIEDETGKILVYEGKAPSAAVGDKVSVNGVTSKYANLIQIGSPSVEVKSSGNDVKYPEPVVLDGAGMDAQLASTEISYIEYTGVLSVAGNYYNVAVEGASTAVGSVSYPGEALGLNDLDGKSVTVTGYYIGMTGSKYVNTMAVSVEEAASTADYDIDGKQWCFNWEAMGVDAVLDLGVTEEGTAIIAYEQYGVWNPYIVAEYTVSKTDGTSGVIVLTLDGMSAEIPYSDATENTVHVEYASLSLDNDCTLATELIPISLAGGNTLDGKQWAAEMDGISYLFDFGLAEEGMLTIALPSMDGTEYFVHMVGLYEIAPVSETSGVVTFYQYDWEWDEILDPIDIQYSDLGEASVNIICENVFGVSDPVAFDLVNYPYEISLPGGGDGPDGAIPDGEYWFFNGNKVMAPSAEGEVSGFLPAEDGVDGASTEKNVFTLTYDPDYSYYTIQDSYGRYLGNESWGEDISLTTVLPKGDDYAYYLWSVDPGFDDGTFDVYNAASYNGFAYSAANNYWYLDPSSFEVDGIRPTLVSAAE